MRHVSREGDRVTFISDEEEIGAVASKVTEDLAALGYEVNMLTSGSVTVFTCALGCKRWERAEKALISEEAIRLLNEAISSRIVELHKK